MLIILRGACASGVRTPDTAPLEAFVQAWNELMEKPALIENLSEENVLQRYRNRELTQLVDIIGWIETPSY